jgi:hypothetical protein
MADQDFPTPGNGSGEPAGAPEASTLGQYIKDLSVEQQRWETHVLGGVGDDLARERKQKPRSLDQKE